MSRSLRLIVFRLIVLTCSVSFLAGCGDSAKTPGKSAAQAPGDAKTAQPSNGAAQLSAAETQRLADEADDAWDQGDHKQAQAKYEQILASQPQNRQALYSLAVILHERGRSALARGNRQAALPLLTHSSQLLDRLAATYPDDLDPRERRLIGTNAYDVACAQALSGDKQQALDALRRAVEFGYNDPDHIANDSDLDSLHDEPEYRKLVGELNQRMAEDLKQRLASFKPFPFELNVSDLEGQPLSLSALRGKVVIVDLWGTWCPPCRAEIPHFIRLYEQYHKQGFEMVGINFEMDDDPAQLVKDFIKEYKIPYPCALGNDAIEDQVPNLEGFPTTLFIDREGVVRMQLVGLHSYATLELLVTTLLKEPADDSAP